jgi:6-pyruvoyltetrahydropterin/6-carboxytetrahydropterin synthase
VSELRPAGEGRLSGSTTSATIRHNFETAHRLPHIGGKCQNLHGHSWWVEVTVVGEPGEDGIVIEFGAFKASLRTWIDVHLDHGSMLGADDDLVPALRAVGSKVFVFDVAEPSDGLRWPTVENVAELLRRVTEASIREEGWTGVRVARVHVQETHVNAAAVAT